MNTNEHNQAVFEMIKRKWCYKCQRMKSVKQFYKNRAKKDGLSSSCSECMKEAKNAWAAKNREHIKNYNRKPEQYAKRKTSKRRWEAKNPDKVKAMKHRDYIRHKVKYLLRASIWQKRHWSHRLSYMRRYNNNLMLGYIRRRLYERTILTAKDLPLNIVEAMTELLRFRKIIKEKTDGNKKHERTARTAM